MGLRAPFAPVPFGFNSPIKFIIYTHIYKLSIKTAKIEPYSYHSNAYFVSIFLYMHTKHFHIFPNSSQIALFQV